MSHMHFAHSEAALLWVLCTTLVYWLSGFGFLRLFPRGWFCKLFPLSSAFGVPIGVGLLVRYLAELVTGDSSLSELACVCIAAFGAGTAVQAMKSTWKDSGISVSWGNSIPLLAVALTLWLVSAYPTVGADPKVIWLFHGKMIFLGNGINITSGFGDPDVAFSHPYYPKLASTLAASVARSLGFWNDYLPKLCVGLLLLPLLTLFSDLWLSGRRRLAAISLLVVVSGGGQLLYDGHMDGVLGAWLTGFLISLGGIFTDICGSSRDSHSPKNFFFVFSALAIGVMINLKSEGLPLALVFVSLPLVTEWRTLWGRRNGALGVHSSALTIMLLAVACLITWRYDCVAWGLNSDMTRDVLGVWRRFWSRSVDPSVLRLCLGYFSAHLAPWWLVCVMFVGYFGLRRSSPNTGIGKLCGYCFVGSGVYSLFLLCVYLSTFYDVKWHLETSAFRTLLPPQNALMVGLGFLMLSGDKNEGPT